MRSCHLRGTVASPRRGRGHLSGLHPLVRRLERRRNRRPARDCGAPRLPNTTRHRHALAEPGAPLARTSTGATTSPTTAAVHADYGTLDDLDALIAAAARARHRPLARPRAEPHLRPARLVQRPARVLRLVGAHPERLEVDLHRRERLGVRRTRQAATTCTSSRPSSPTSTGGTPPCATSSTTFSASGSTAACAGFRIDVAHGLIKDRGCESGERYMRDRPEVHEIYARWQEIAGEYDPEADADGRDLRPRSTKLPAYYAAPRPRAELPVPERRRSTLDELRPIVETTMAELPKGREPVWFGSNHDHSRMATRWAGGDERKHKAALFLLLTLPGSAILYQGDELGLEDGVVPADRILDVADPPRDPERTPFPWTRERRGMARPVAPARRHLAQRRGQHDPAVHARADRAAQGARRRLPHAAERRRCVGLRARRRDVRAQHDRRHRRARRSDTPALAGADPAAVLAKG